MIKHVILVGKGVFFADGVEHAGKSEFISCDGTAIMLSDNESNGTLFSKDLTFKYKNMITVFPLPPRSRDYLSVTAYPLYNLIKGGVRTNISFNANETFNLPISYLTNGMLASTAIDTEGKIIPGIYGFMLVKKNVDFNRRNKWYIEIVVKEDTSYSDFATLLDSKFKAIDKNLTLTEDDGTFTLVTSSVTDNAYELMLADVAEFAFTKPVNSGINNRIKAFVKKLCREADGNYGFDYTTVEGAELYKNRTDEMYNELISIIKSEDISTLYALNLQFNEPSYYRTVDEKINKVITIIADYTVINALLTGIGVNLDNVLDSGSAGTEESSRAIGDATDDGMIDVEDVNALINVITGESSLDPGELTYYDVNGDGLVDVEDVNALINFILKNGNYGNAGNVPIRSLTQQLTNAVGWIAISKTMPDAIKQYRIDNATEQGGGGSEVIPANPYGV